MALHGFRGGDQKGDPCPLFRVTPFQSCMNCHLGEKEPPLFSGPLIRQSDSELAALNHRNLGVDPMTTRTQRAFWFVSGLLLVTLVSASLKLVVAQPQGGASRPAFDASEPTFVSLGEHTLVNINNIAYTSDEGGVFDIYFACSSTRGPDPLRLIDPKDVARAKSYFNDEKQYGKHFEKHNKHCMNAKHIAYIESKGDSVTIYFSARISDAFVQLTLSGADADSFRKKRREF